jgi:fatty-acyl-CoA synthase
MTRADDDPDDRAATLGRPLPAVEVRIADPADGGTVAPGAVGELCTRGYHVMTGYFDAPEQTAAAIDADGWLHTGDLATMDERGYCRIAGRLKDMIIRGGENIYPREIEDVLFTHPAVAEVAVVGVPDARWGEVVKAFVVLRDNELTTPRALMLFLRGRIADFKIPSQYEFVAELPRNSTGKVLRRVLRDRVPVPAGEAVR